LTEEFLLSNALFLTFLYSNEFAFASQTDLNGEEAQKFHEVHIYPILDQLVFYKRRRLLPSDTNSNSAHEGTNRALTSHAAPTNPQHTLEKAAMVLSHQTQLKSLILPDADGIGSQVCVSSSNPDTRWARHTLLCCFDRIGIPCRHIMALLDFILGDDFKGITVNDVRVFWRIYSFFYGMQPRNNMLSLLLELRETDTQDPILHGDKVKTVKSKQTKFSSLGSMNLLHFWKIPRRKVRYFPL
jgi:hypothetical protein